MNRRTLTTAAGGEAFRQPVVAMLVSVLVAVVVFGCSSSQKRSDEAPTADSQKSHDETDAEPSDSDRKAEGKEADGEEAESCLGKVTPPPGVGGRQFLQEPAVHSKRDIDEVIDEAKEKLLQRLCQGYRCQTLEPEVRTWKIQEAGGYKCSKAVIPKNAYDQWVESNKKAVERKLNKAAQRLVESADSGSDGILTLGLERVEDRRALGTARARWLYDKMQESLDKAGARTVPLQTAFQAAKIPEDVDGTVHGRVYSRRGQEALLEVSWKLSQGGAVVGARSVEFAEVLSPEVDRKAFLPDVPSGNDDVKLHFDFKPGEGVCHGQRLQLWLETGRDLHVRVVNLFGGGDGAIIYPRNGESGRLEAGSPVSLGQFRALQSDGGRVEYWMVLAAPAREDLGKFAELDEVCRLPSSVVATLKEGEGITEEVEKRMTVQSYPIRRKAQRCRDFEVDEETLDRAKHALRNMPTCWNDR